MTVQDASHLWFFESHSNSKRSQWLQSTLSELEQKIKGMLKLIEGDADTFAQRAEMYYKKRPELVNTIEDFYRSYRSLAERCDQHRLESANSSNRGLSLKEWSFIDKSSAASSIIFDSESEVDDPSEDEEDQVESKSRKVLRNKAAGAIHKVGIKRERLDLFTYSLGSEVSEVSSPELKEIHVELKPEKSREKKSEICVVKPMIDKNESAKVKASNAPNMRFEQSELYDEPNDGQGENNPLGERNTSKKSETCVVKPMIGKVEITKDMVSNAAHKCFERFESLHREPDEGQGGYNLSEISEKKGDNHPSHPLAEAMKSKMESFQEKISGSPSENWEVVPYEREEAREGRWANDAEKLMNEVERLRVENASFRTELGRKDEEKREVIRQLCLSVDVLKGENDDMKKLIRDSRNRNNPFEFRKLKGVFSKKLFGGGKSKFPTTLVAL